MVEWNWNDGWILMSLFLARGGAEAELHDLIEVADATNHAIPTTKELSSALAKFVRCGLITVEEGRYKLAQQHVHSIRQAFEAKGGLFESGKKGLNWLKVSGLIELCTKRVIVSEAKAKAAYNQYIKRMRNR